MTIIRRVSNSTTRRVMAISPTGSARIPAPQLRFGPPSACGSSVGSTGLCALPIVRSPMPNRQRILRRWLRRSHGRRDWGLFAPIPKPSRPTAKRWPISCLATISQPFGPATRYFFKVGQGGPTEPKPRDSPRCDAALPSIRSKVGIGFCPVSKRHWPKPKGLPARPMQGSSAWTTRSSGWGALSSAGTKRKCTASAAAEQSLEAAIAIAQSQKARSFELRAALSLAELYYAANRDADAHAVLAPAVEGFPPTQQFPELTEAQTLLAALSESDAVKSAAALRQRRVHLQTSLGNALIWSKGQQAPETSAAFAHARELANQVEDTAERFSAYYGLWVGHLTRGEPASMREMAELFLREATASPNCPEVVIAHRNFGTTCFYFGDY